MASDYFPKSLDNLKTWLTGLSTGVTNDGPNLGQDAAQVASDIALINSLLNAVNDALTARTAWLDAEGTARTAVGAKKKPLRDMINRYKHAVGWTDGMEAAWAVATSETSYDMSIHHPNIVARAIPGQIEITGNKPGFTSVNIQMRLEGSSDWLTIGVKINHFPFFDTTAPQVAGKPEKREYRALGMSGDQQVGQPSQIVTAVWSD